METEWMTIVTITGALFGLLVSAHFITIRRRGISVRWLGLYTLMLTAGLIEPYFSRGSLLTSILGGISLLYGPSLYLYVKSRVLGIDRISARDARHLIPFAGYVLLVVGSWILPHRSPAKDSGGLDVVLYELLFMQIFFYLFKTVFFIYRKKISNMYEDLDVAKMHIAFLRVLVILSAVLLLGSYLMTHIYLLGNRSLSSEFKSTVQIGLCCVIFVIALLNTETMHARKLIKSV